MEKNTKERIVGVLIAITIVAILNAVALSVYCYGAYSDFRYSQKNIQSFVISKSIVERVMSSVVHIETDVGWQGSGSYIGNGLILTAGHIVDEGWSFTITFEDGTEYISTDFYLESASDVRFIYIGDCNSPVLIFDNDGYLRGDTAFVFGNPFGWDYCFSVSKGIISSVNRDCEGFFGEKIMLQVDAATYPGNSGGPVTDDEGEIIGILVGGPAWSGDNIGLCIPGKICRRAMITYLSILEMAKLQ